MSESPAKHRFTLRKLLLAVTWISIGFGLTKAPFTIVDAYFYLPESVEIFLWCLFAAAGAAFGAAVAEVFGHRLFFMITGTFAWPLVLILTSGIWATFLA